MLKKPSMMLADFETAAPSVMFFNCSLKVFPVSKLKVLYSQITNQIKIYNYHKVNVLQCLGKN